MNFLGPLAKHFLFFFEIEFGPLPKNSGPTPLSFNFGSTLAWGPWPSRPPPPPQKKKKNRRLDPPVIIPATLS